jgi:heme exporter protein D
MERIIAEYGFYLGWSFGLTAFLMILEPIVLNSQRKAVLQRLHRMLRAKNASQ